MTDDKGSQTTVGATIFEMLFDVLPENMLDPNKPENIPALKAKRELRKREIKSFWDGPGKVLKDTWQVRIRTELVDIVTKPDAMCHCSTCSKIKTISLMLNVLSEAKTTITQDKD